MLGERHGANARLCVFAVSSFPLSARKKEVRLINEHLSPSNAQRLRVFEAYRGRGRRSSNLFVVYSVKTGQDWVLPSDRHLVHWIHYLETDPEVHGFTFAPEGNRADSRLCIIDVLLSNGTRIKHQLGQKRVDQNDHALEPKNNNTSPTATRIFTDEDLRPFVKTSLRWLKAIAFASALREQEYTHQTLLLLEYFRQQTRGDVGQVLAKIEVCEHEAAVILGLIVRLSIKGHIRLDLTANAFGYRTPWTLLAKGS